jgi:trehalose/maltose transport system substrate-binding protein
MRHRIFGAALATALIATTAARAAEITLACGWQELEVRLCEEAAATWSAQSGHTVKVVRGPEQSNQRYFEYLDLLGRSDRSLDVLQIDVIWPSALAGHLVDLSEHVPTAELAEHFAPLVANNTIDGRLVAMPWFTDAGILYYRKDLLAKYGMTVPGRGPRSPMPRW